MKVFSLFTYSLIFGFFSLSSVVHSSVDVYFSPKGGARDTIISELAKTQKTLNIAMYSFSDSKLMNQVKELSQNGVKVRLLLNQANRSKEKSNEFEEAGVDVRYVNMIMHHKFAIIDQNTLLTGSQNWSASAENSYDEDFLVFKNENDKLNAFQSEFSLMWNKARDFVGPASDGEQLEDFEASFASVYFTSKNFKVIPYRGAWSFRTDVGLNEGIAGNAIIRAIENAGESIQIATAHFRRKDFYEALKSALDRGVEVQIILDGQEYDGHVPQDLADDDTEHFDEILSTLGAEVRYKMYSRYWDHATAKQMHSKYMVIDGKTVLTGSFNWSKNAELATFENLISLKSGEAQYYAANFLKIRSYGENTLKALIEEVKDSNGRSPCVFAPMSLLPSEVEQLRKAYASGACRR